MSQTIKMLTNLHTVELSNVRRAANRRRYAITKSEESQMNLDQVTKAVMGTEAEGEAQFVATLKSAGADDKRVAASVALYRIQKGFADVMKSEDVDAVAKAAGYAKKAKKDDEEAADEEEDSDEEMPAFLKGKGAKKSKKSADAVNLASLAPEIRAQVESVFKSNADLVAKSDRLESLVQTLIDQSAQREFVTKAERDFSHIPGTPTEIAAVLKSAHEADPKMAQGLEKILAAVNGIVQKSAMFTSIGGAGGGGANGSAWNRIEQLSSSLTLKSEKGGEMTSEQKIAHVISKTAEGRALYREYLAENPAQRAKYNF